MKFVFACEVHPIYGQPGWRLLSQPGFDPLSGLAVAHDILEHFSDGSDTIHDELQAFGAMIWIRGDGGEWESSSVVGRVLAEEFWELLAHIKDGARLQEAPCTRPAEKFAEEAIAASLDKCTSEDFTPERKATFRNWLRRGYSRAKRRYYNHYSNDVCWLFKEIEKEADHALEESEPGYRMAVHVDFRRLKHWIDVDHPYIPFEERYRTRYRTRYA